MGRREERGAELRAGLGAVAGAVALALALTGTAGAVTREEALLRLGGLAGGAAGQIKSPEAIAADPGTGQIFLGDSFNNRIDEFTPWGEFVKAFGWNVAPGAVNEQQEVRVKAAHGTFKLSFESETTADIPFNASAKAVEEKLEALAAIHEGDIGVSERVGATDGTIPFIYAVTFEGPLAGSNVQQLGIANGAEALGGGVLETEAEVRTRAEGTAGGSGLEDCTTESGCQAGLAGPGAGEILSPVFDAPLAVSPSGDVYVAESDNAGTNQRVQEFSPSGRFLRMWGGDVIVDGAAGSGTVSPGSASITSVVTTEKAFRVGQAIQGTGIEAGTTIAALGAGTITLSKLAGPAATGTTTALTVAPGPGNAAANERQTVRLGANTTSGSFTLTFKTPNPSQTSNTTEAIPWNATSAELKGKLEALPNIGAAGGEVAVTGSTGGPWTVEFKGARYAGSDVERMEANASGLTVSSGAKEATVTSANAVELCEAAAECQAGAEGTANGQFGAGALRIGLAPGGGTVYTGNGERVQEFGPTGAYSGDLPDPGETRKGRSIAGLAVSPKSGALYLDFSPGAFEFPVKEVDELGPATGALTAKLAVADPRALAADSAGDLYVINGGEKVAPVKPHVTEFDAAGSQVVPSRPEEEECEEEVTGYEAICASLGIQADEGLSFGGSKGLGAGPNGDLYVANVSGAERYVRAYGPAPLGLESPPLAPPSIEEEFAASADTSGAELRAKINPHFFSGALGTTTYYVQYGTAACVEATPEEADWEAPCVKEQPAPPGAKLRSGAVSEDVAVSVFLAGLQAGTAYRYRFVAEGSGAPGVEVTGAKEAFATAPGPGTPQACPGNEAFRSGPAATLPDCRAYEMVSPPDKGGGDIVILPSSSTGLPDGLDQSAVLGERLAYATYKSFGDAQSAPFTSEYVAARHERGGPGEGWQSHAISPPRAEPLTELLGQLNPEFQLFSADLCEGWNRTFAEPPLGPGAITGYFNLYRRTDGECGGPSYEALSTVEPNAPRGVFQIELQGLAAGGEETFIGASGGQMTADAPALEGKNELQLYERAGGQLHFVCILPDGKPAQTPCSAGGPPGFARGQGYTGDLQNAVAGDGERVFWSAAGETENAPIYLRAHPARAQSALAGGIAEEGKGSLTAGSKTVSSLITGEATGNLTAGSEVLALSKVSFGEFLAGQAVSAKGVPPGTTILSCAPACGRSPTSLTLSAAVEAGKSKTGATIKSTGPAPFAVGQRISGPGIPYGTKVEAAAAGSLTLSAEAGQSKTEALLSAAGECSEPQAACTLAVSEAAEVQTGTSGSRYLSASEDGSVAIFTTASKLYEARIEEEAGQLVSHTQLIAGGYLGFLGASEDARRVYFASSETLTSGPNAQGKSPTLGQPNLYLYDAGRPEGERFAFIGTLSSVDLLHAGDSKNFTSAISQEPGGHSARVSANGAFAAFNSSARLTDYDNADQVSGEPDTEVYLYEAEAGGGKGRLVCASCNPSGARPQGDPGHKEKPFWVAGKIPGAETDLYASKPLSVNGRRLFFDSFDALAPNDTDGTEDVYEWEAPDEVSCTKESSAYSPQDEGCVSLISSGKSQAGSEFLDADSSGANVFFTTLSSLVPQDPGQIDIYDAREGGGFPPPPSPPAQCEGEACQPPAQAPNDATPASAAFAGAGNVTEAPAKRKHGHKAKKRHRKQHKRRGSR